jgi:hypothetical protein
MRELRVCRIWFCCWGETGRGKSYAVKRRPAGRRSRRGADLVIGADAEAALSLSSPWHSPTPSVTKIVWSCGWVCQAVRAPGAICTAAAAITKLPAGAATASV